MAAGRCWELGKRRDSRHVLDVEFWELETDRVGRRFQPVLSGWYSARLSHDSLTLTQSLTKLGKKDAVGFQNSCDSLPKAKDFPFLRDLGKLSSRTTYDPTPKLGPGEGFPAPYLADGIPGALWFCDR